MAWTPEQEKAIFDRGKNTIVSAGAGSGKTAVLSERILEYCKMGKDIRRVLVLTFTKAAALEMKERIRKKLLDNQLYQQAEYIDSAYITTFDSYSLALVKKYYYKLGISKNISIMDSGMIEMKRNEIILDLFKDYYENNNQDFLSFLAKYTKQDDKEIVGIVLNLCKKLDLIIDTEKYINDYDKNYFSNEKVNEIVNDYELHAIESVEELKIALVELLDLASVDPASGKLYDSLLGFYNSLKSNNQYEYYYDIINQYSLPRISTKADLRVKDLKNNVADLLKNIKEKVFSKYSSKEAMANEIISTKSDILFLLNTCNMVINRLMEYKSSVGLYDFNDIAKLAIRLVYNNDDVRLELQSYYEEILVDEYQDTSDMQECFLTAIENNNRYMVGDIKQSIYRFRNANPYIFKSKYEEYSKEQGGKKIDLTFNFRSREEVLNDINLLFNKLMTDSCGDASYEDSHQMQYGQKLYEEISQDISFNLDVLSYSSEAYPEYSKAEIEVFIIAKSIKDIISSKAQVLKGKTFVPVQYSDFAILIDKTNEFVLFKQIFEFLGIPLSIEADLDLKDSILPKLMTNILLLIQREKNELYDKAYYHAKASLGRSFIYEMTDEDIFKAIYLKEHTEIDDDIKELAGIKEISYSKLFYVICEKFKIYDKLALIGNVDNSLIILEAIHNMMKSLSDTAFTLDEAVDYLMKLFDSSIKLSYTLAEGNKNSVRIMTIHKSKGLEFAYCYFPLLSSSFNKQDERASIGLDRKYGVYIPYADEGKSNTIIKPLVAKSIRQADISERVRLLYVALTRAREKMILVMDQIEYKKINPKSFNSFQEMIEYTGVFNQYIKELDLSDYNISKGYMFNNKSNAKTTGEKVISYYEPIQINELTKSKISKAMTKLPDSNVKRSMDLGIEMHEVLEILDFSNPNLEDLPVSQYVKDKIAKVLGLDIFKNIKEGKSYHEHEFYLIDDTHSYHGIIDLFIEYKEHIDIIDYKLYDTESPDYVKQLSIYKKYIESKTNKQINVYLLSIIKGEIFKLNI